MKIWSVLKYILTFLAGIAASVAFILWKTRNASNTQTESAARIAYQKDTWDFEEIKRKYTAEVAAVQKDIENAKAAEIIDRFHTMFGVKK